MNWICFMKFSSRDRRYPWYQVVVHMHHTLAGCVCVVGICIGKVVGVDMCRGPW